MAKDLHEIPEDPIPDFEGIIGESEAIQNVIKAIKNYAHLKQTVVLQGETGVGKNLVADAILAKSQRAEPYRYVNCGEIGKAESYESHYLGHEKGAFTGADSQHIGIFEQANKGTVFLDEVAETTSDVQKAFLNIVENKPFARVGGNENIRLDIRFIAATNVDLAKAYREGKFRQDLYYRLNRSCIHIPPLRDRREDIPLLVCALIQKFRCEQKKTINDIEKNALDLLKKTDWPGNVRQLESVIYDAIAWAETDTLNFTGIKKAYEGLNQRTTETYTPPPNYGKLVSQFVINLHSYFQNWRLQINVEKVKRVINSAIFTDIFDIESIEEAYEGSELTSETGTPPTSYDALISEFVIDLNAYFQNQGLKVEIGKLRSVITDPIGMATKQHRQLVDDLRSESSIPTQDDSQLMPSSEWIETLKGFVKENNPKLDLNTERLKRAMDTLGALIEGKDGLKIDHLKKDMPYYTTSDGKRLRYASTGILYPLYEDIIKPILEEKINVARQKGKDYSDEVQDGFNNKVIEQLKVLLEDMNPQLKKAKDAIDSENATQSP